jgi:hypothetical protein
MNAFWAYFWPPFAAALIIGLIGGLIAFRAPRVRSKHTDAELDEAVAKWRQRRLRAIVAGLLLSIATACLWHGPLGAADRFSSEVERTARQVLADNDAPTGMAVQIHRGPLTREMILSGPADDFQHAESVRLVGLIPGVSDATWTRSAGIPLIVQGAIAAVLGFLLGLLLAYLIELRRRYNAQWNW